MVLLSGCVSERVVRVGSMEVAMFWERVERVLEVSNRVVAMSFVSRVKAFIDFKRSVSGSGMEWRDVWMERIDACRSS